ncbi:unnamed protein product [Calypogeia fissa]
MIIIMLMKFKDAYLPVAAMVGIARDLSKGTQFLENSLGWKVEAEWSVNEEWPAKSIETRNGAGFGGRELPSSQAAMGTRKSLLKSVVGQSLVKLQDLEDGGKARTALHVAARRGDLKLMQQILNMGSDEAHD